jgi:hypothetical protein
MGKVEKLGNLNDLRYWNFHKGTKKQDKLDVLKKITKVI